MHLEYFQMIDEVVAVNRAESSIVAMSTVPGESPVFEGHFPGYPLVPGVLLIETMAQASGYLIMALNDFAQLPLLATVKDAKIRAPVEPHALLTIESAIEHDGSGFAVMRARVESEGTAVCDARLNMKLTAFPNEELRKHILASAQTAGLLALEG